MNLKNRLTRLAALEQEKRPAVRPIRVIKLHEGDPPPDRSGPYTYIVYHLPGPRPKGESS